MASALRRDPKRGRRWYAPERRPIPPLVSFAELEQRTYGPGGPKEGVRPRADAQETLYGVLRYLHVRAGRERGGEGSADFAAAFSQLIQGLRFELSRRSAKAWDPALGAGLAPEERDELLIRRRGRALAQWLDHLTACGVLVWGGERDNNGLWWRLRIRLLDPDGPPVEREPWMRPSPRLAEPLDDGRGGAGERRGAGAGRGEPAQTPPGLNAVYGRLVELGWGRPSLSAALEGRIVAAAARYAANARQRPAGLSEDPWEVLSAQIEQCALHRGHPLVRALPLFDALSRRLEKHSKNTVDTAQGRPGSPNCAGLSEQATACTTKRSLNPETSASRTGARLPEKNDGRHPSTNATKSPVENSRGWVGGKAGTAPDPFEGLTERVAARERLWEALSGPARAADAETVARARSWPSERPAPIGLLTAAVEVLVGRRPWLDDSRIARLRRAECRYKRYAAHRPGGAPAGPAGALVALVEHRPGAVHAPLHWAIAQLDLLSKRMRRDAKRPATGEREAGQLERRRRRAERRRRREAAEEQSAWWRRPGPRAAVEQAVAPLAERVLAGEVLVGGAPSLEAAVAGLGGSGRPVDDERRCSLRWHLGALAERLFEQGVPAGAEDLRRELRDELLLTGAPAHYLLEVDGPAGALPAPERFDPGRAQLHPGESDPPKWLMRRRDRDCWGAERVCAAQTRGPRSVPTRLDLAPRAGRP